MKYKDPITGELRDVIIKSGDTLPIGTVVEFDGDTIPDGYEEFETEDYGSLGNIIVDDITCKNMFNKNTAIDGYALLSATGELNKVDGWCASEYIPVKAGEKITISGKDSAGSGNCFYDVNKNYIETITAVSGTIIVPNNAYYLRINLKLDDKDTCQVEPGSVATDYVEHKEFSNKQIYSASEQVIGTWIDGKPLYRKVIDFGALPNTTSKSVAHDISNIDYIVDIRATAALPGGDTMKLDASDKDGLKFSVHISANNTNITVLTGSDRSVFTRCYVTLEYTKTTD